MLQEECEDLQQRVKEGQLERPTVVSFSGLSNALTALTKDILIWRYFMLLHINLYELGVADLCFLGVKIYVKVVSSILLNG